MKNSFLLLLLLVCTYFPLKAQMNLVPNPSFENVLSCPNGLGQIYLANSWLNNGISPDLFCECSPFGVNVPNNNVGYQYANTGECMAGLVTFQHNNPNIREFIGTNLLQPLNIGSTYYFSCYINFPGGIITNISTNNFGAKFKMNQLDSTQSSILLTNSSDVNLNFLLNDTMIWYHLRGQFIADSSYSYLILGNFFDDQNTDTITIPIGNPNYGYYFIDDICLSTDSLYCENWTSNQEIPDSDSKLILYPNPVLSNLNITAETGIKSIAVKSVLGRQLLFNEVITETSILLNLTELNSGIYIIEIDFGEFILNRKIIKL